MENAYDVVLTTPTLYRRGTLVLEGAGEEVDARFDAGDGQVFAARLSREGSDIALHGMATTPSGRKVACDLEGSIWGNAFGLKGSSEIGDVDLYGTRLSLAAGDFAKGSDPYYAGMWSDAG